MKKIIYFLLTFFGIIMIYSKYNNKYINFLSFNDNLGCYYYNELIKNYLDSNNKLLKYNDFFISNNIDSLIKNIKNNRTIRYNNQDFYIKKELRESDIIVIFVGQEELYNYYDKYDIKNNYYYFNKMYENIQLLIKEINKYAKGKILFLGYYNPTDYYDSKSDEFFYNINTKLSNLMAENNIKYIDLYEKIKENNYKNDNIHLNYAGNKMIMDIISIYLEENT